VIQIIFGSIDDTHAAPPRFSSTRERENVCDHLCRNLLSQCGIIISGCLDGGRFEDLAGIIFAREQ
jgi:hypothetical protein